MANFCVGCSKVQVSQPGTRCGTCRQSKATTAATGAKGGMPRGPAPAMPAMFDRSKKALNLNLVRLLKDMNAGVTDQSGKLVKKPYDPAHTEASLQLANALEKLEKSEERWMKANQEWADALSEAEVREYMLEQVDALPLAEAVELMQEMTRKLNARRGAA